MITGYIRICIEIETRTTANDERVFTEVNNDNVVGTQDFKNVEKRWSTKFYDNR